MMSSIISSNADSFLLKKAAVFNHWKLESPKNVFNIEYDVLLQFSSHISLYYKFTNHILLYFFTFVCSFNSLC